MPADQNVNLFTWLDPGHSPVEKAVQNPQVSSHLGPQTVKGATQDCGETATKTATFTQVNRQVKSVSGDDEGDQPSLEGQHS